MIILSSLFDEFCKSLDGKLRWAKPKGKDWTNTVFSFFSEFNKKESIPYLECKEYMTIDYVWRYDLTRYSVYDIELALEHEGEAYKVDEIIAKEIRHLIDIKARCKICIFYPSHGDEAKLIERISKEIKSQSDLVKLADEKYLVILGYATTKAGRRAILFRGFFFDSRGNLESKKEHVISQAKKV